MSQYPPQAPPIVQGQVARRPGQWPSVVGIIGIVLAGLGLLTGLLTAATPLFMRGMSAFFANLQAKSGSPAAANPALAQWDVIARMGWVYITAGLLSCAVWAWGLSIFIAIYKRRRGSMDRAALWAWVKIALNVLAVAGMTYVQWLSMQSMIADMSKNMAGTPGAGAPPPAIMNTTMLASTIFSGVFGLIFYSAFPVFLLIYARTRAARAETATW